MLAKGDQALTLITEAFPMNSNLRMIVTGGGTGGHFFPAQAICESLRNKGVKVKYMGSRYGIESNYFNNINSLVLDCLILTHPYFDTQR